MQITSRLSIFALLFLTMSLVSSAKDDKTSDQDGGQVDTEEEVEAYIDHHLDDSHYFNLFSDGKTGEHFGIPLPVIIYDFDNGLHAFSASKFHHGEDLVEINGQHYKLYHSKIYKTDAEGTITYDEEGFVENEKPIDFSITKNVIGMILASVLLFWMFTSLAKSYRKNQIPKGIGRFLEPLVIYVRDEIAKPNIGPKYKKYMSFLLTVFFFIWILNLMGMTPLGFNVTGNIAVTFGLALITFIIVQFSGNKDYWKHIFWMPGVPIPMKIVLMPIEILGMFTKPFALMIRLFANMTAGHVVIMSLLGLIVVMQNWIAGPAFFGFTIMISVIELLVAFLQAYIFTLLSALYIGMAVEDHSDHSEDVPVV
ncbi:MAG: F0F1 ATP synthase subunit A [Bacteroidetes bacterium]|jgi:F-type H+-transporting ATPase subunit a|nr:F0F1 ATP synthase subunit A [Bacteroidota bacterium]